MMLIARLGCRLVPGMVLLMLNLRFVGWTGDLFVELRVQNVVVVVDHLLLLVAVRRTQSQWPLALVVNLHLLRLQLRIWSIFHKFNSFSMLI
jgi:hypothetical protein